MRESRINWTHVGYVVGAAWLISAALWLLSELQHFHFNPIPAVAAAIVGAAIHGYVGAGDSYLPAMIFLYATLVGLGVSLFIQKSGVKPALVIGITVAIHLVVSFFALLPLMLIGGR
jgi:hypothetical protein